jgi:uncharacterized protein YcfL
MKKAILILLLLSGCADTQIIAKTNQEVVMPPAELMTCQVVSVFPNPDALTDIEVANLLTQLFQYNQGCYNNIQNIQEFLNKAKNDIEQK